MSNVKNVTKADFDGLLKEEGLIMIDFSATWCPPCKMMAPIFDNLAEDPELKDVSFVTVDIDQENALAAQFQVMSVPTFLMIEAKGDGTFEEKQKWVGARDPLTFKSEIQAHVS